MEYKQNLIERLAKPFKGWGLTKWRPFYVIKKVYKKYINRLQKRSITIDGNTIYTDPVDSIGLLTTNGAHEPWTTALFKKIIHAGDVVVDVGAHIGYFTLIAAKLANKSGMVYAFEPNPESLQYLEKNIAINMYTNVEIIPKIVSEKSEVKVNLFLSDATSSIMNSGSFDAVSVETITLDDFFRDRSDSKKIKLIKVDAEGADMLVIRGMKKVIENNPGLHLIIECNPQLLEMAHISAEGFFNELWSLGFKTFAINKTGQAMQKDSLPKDIERYLKTEKVENILCVKQ